MKRRAKTINDNQYDRAHQKIDETSDNPLRDHCLLALSFREGMRAQEIARIELFDITDVEGRMTDVVHVSKRGAKYGKERSIPMHPEVRHWLVKYLQWNGIPQGPLFFDRFGFPMNPNSVEKQIARIYRRCGYVGASSHSGRRSFITRGAQRAHFRSSSLVDVQYLAGHASLQTTSDYIDQSPFHKELVDLIGAKDDDLRKLLP